MDSNLIPIKESSRSSMPSGHKHRVSVVVLGDLGRSPRMQYHAFSLATAGSEVDVIGYRQNGVISAIESQPRIYWHNLRESWRAPVGGSRALFLIGGMIKISWDSTQLFWTLLRVAKPQIVLVQNPPTIPTLLLAWIAARLRRARLVIDWHNFSHAMIALKIGSKHPLVCLVRSFEQRIGRRADVHLCVSRAMQELLQREWQINARVLYDCPPYWFARSSAEERRNIFDKMLGKVYPVIDFSSTGLSRPRLLVSPSSWTADEDYSLLLDGLRLWDQRCCNESTLLAVPEGPSLIVLLTGKGPLRARFEAEIRSLQLRHVVVRTLWVEADDYPRLLGIADAGICMHRSASGFDLPMKIADMFGSGLPVVAFDYGPCLRERLEPGVTGLVFRTAEELAERLNELFPSGSAESSLLRDLQTNVLSRASRRWEDEWTAVAGPVLMS